MPLPADHPLRSAHWIWPANTIYLQHHLAQFRRDFVLAAVPAQAVFHITADQHYRLWVNGRYVGRGPARGYQEHWPFDTYDLAPYLNTGGNWLSIEGYQGGISTFQYIHRSIAGMICAGRFGGVDLRSDLREWKMRRDPAMNHDRARLSRQLGFQEDVDGARCDRTWIEDPVVSGDWGSAPHLFGSGGEDHPFGRPPWEGVEERGIPLLREEPLAPTGIVAEASGPCDANWKTWFNLAWPWIAEATAATWTAPTLPTRVVDGWLEIVVPPAGADAWRALTIDAGAHVVATPELAAAGATGGEIVDLQFVERFLDGRPELREAGSACGIALAHRLRLAPGATRRDFHQLLGFRFCTLVVRGATRPITLRLRLRTAGYPFAMRGTFSSDDGVLDAIHAACRHTQRICSLDAYVDTPWREQAQWWGDARVQAKNTFFLDGDSRLLARGVRSIAGQLAPQGLTYGHAPTVAYNCILPDFALTWILTVRDHWWQTGDTALVCKQWPRIQEVLAYFDAPEARTPEGLLRHDRRYWLFEDWSDLWKGEVPTFLNLWYVVALRGLVEALRAAGMDTEAAAIAAKAETHARLADQLLFRPDLGLFGEGLDAPPDRASVHDQTLALMLGLRPEAHARMLERCLVPWSRDQAVPGAKPSAFWATYVFDELAKRGHGADVITCIRRRWQPMLATGTTWEGFTWSEKGGTVSHAWTAHPSYHLVEILAGLRQTAPGWRKVTVAPCLVPGVDRVRALVPAPPGDIAVCVERHGAGGKVTIEAPAGVEVTLPDGRAHADGGRVEATFV